MFATPYPGSDIFDFAIRTGRIDKEKLHEFVLKLGDARDFTINLTDNFSDKELIKKREEMMKISEENYRKYITTKEIIQKMKNLYGSLLDKYNIDEVDMEHRAKHGGISIF